MTVLGKRKIKCLRNIRMMQFTSPSLLSTTFLSFAPSTMPPNWNEPDRPPVLKRPNGRGACLIPRLLFAGAWESGVIRLERPSFL
ncbi:hypothetical protein CEXT_616001 [Caerostris extrusa]|uniref:Uncharacterized protein n=1 Tax=Caerostris extrusa TaxID=172846 RepID=A0AAV4SNE5_CAEEX|nr:hypothetical protein CEXT_616001 [Caerostris extrusa]